MDLGEMICLKVKRSPWNRRAGRLVTQKEQGGLRLVYGNASNSRILIMQTVT